MLGHKQSRTTERYAHFADDSARAAANAMAGRLADALNAGAGIGKPTEMVPIGKRKMKT